MPASRAKLKKAPPKKKPIKAAKKTTSKPKAKKPNGNPVPPDSVRVWRGFKLSSVATPAFFSNLGGIFIPVTAILQRLYGLTAYLPAVLPADKPAGFPDEIALVFYQKQQAYNDTKLIVSGRAYSLLHSAVFDLTQSQSGFPIALANPIAFDTPYYLFPEAVDWKPGFTQVFAGARDQNVQPAAFAASINNFLQKVTKHRPKGLEGAVVVVNANWVLYWEHWTSEGASLHGSISDLAAHADTVLLQPYTATKIQSGLADHYAGLAVEGGETFNIQFPLPDKAKL